MRADIVVTVSLRPEPGGFVLAGAASWRGRRPTWSVAPNTQQTQTANFKHALWAKIQDQGGQTVSHCPRICRAHLVGSRLREGVRRNNATFVMQSQLHRFRAAATGGQCSAICKPEKPFDHWSLHFPSLFELSECDLDLGLIKNGSYVKKRFVDNLSTNVWGMLAWPKSQHTLAPQRWLFCCYFCWIIVQCWK